MTPYLCGAVLSVLVSLPAGLPTGQAGRQVRGRVAANPVREKGIYETETTGSAAGAARANPGRSNAGEVIFFRADQADDATLNECGTRSGECGIG
jgi:hypothetical protein